MVPVSPVQEQTISPEAAGFLRANNQIVIPGPRLTRRFADALNAQLDMANGPFLDQLRRNLRLRVREQTIAGVPVVVIEPRRIRKKRRTVAGFYAHGGGFALLSAKDYTAYRMASDLGIVVYSVEYRRSPRAKFPVALDQTARAYRAVAGAHRTVVGAGSSSGANLLISAILRARRRRTRLPRAVGLLAPAVDMRAIGDSYVANDGRDALVSRDTATKLFAAYLGVTLATLPEASPVLADFRDGFVPTMITTGTRDLLQSDAVRLYWTLRRAGVAARLRTWEGMWHNFESVPGLPEGEQNLSQVFSFLERHI